jgi:hypothetical protein
MKRMIVAALPLVAAALVMVAPVSATTKHHVTCKQIRAELASGKKPSEVASDLKVSKATVNRCSPKVASSKRSGSHQAPAAH